MTERRVPLTAERPEGNHALVHLCRRHFVLFDHLQSRIRKPDLAYTNQDQSKDNGASIFWNRNGKSEFISHPVLCSLHPFFLSWSLSSLPRLCLLIVRSSIPQRSRPTQRRDNLPQRCLIRRNSSSICANWLGVPFA